MKLQELLLELSEKLKRHDAYGSWIDTNTGQIFDIRAEGGHVDYIKSRLQEWGIPKSAVRRTEDYYTVGFAKGMVRTVHHPKHVLVVDGLAKDLKKITPVIMASAAQPDLETVRINKVTKLGDQATNLKSFDITSPQQRRLLQMFMSS